MVVVSTAATVPYIKLYDTSTAPTCNTQAVVQTYPVPTGSNGGGFVLPLPVGISFTNGIGLCMTGGSADNDNSNGPAGVAISYGFK